MEETRKISNAEATMMIGLSIFFDFIDLLATFLDFFFGIGEFIKLISNFIISFILNFGFIIKGARSGWVVAGTLIKFIPFLNILPTRTAALLVAIWLDKHPKVSQKVSLAKKIT